MSLSAFHNRSRRRSESAFTLLEMLLALAVSAIVVAAIGGVFYSALRLRNSAAAALDEEAPLYQALALMRRDLQNALPPSGGMASNLTVNALGGGMSQNASIQFSTSTGTMKPDSVSADIQQVTYELRPSSQGGHSGGNDLFRMIVRNPLGSTVGSEEQFLLGNVESLEFSCYDGIDWRPSWDTSMGNTNLPSAIKVLIKLAGENNSDSRSREPIELVIPMDTLSRTNQTMAGG